MKNNNDSFFLRVINYIRISLSTIFKFFIRAKKYYWFITDFFKYKRFIKNQNIYSQLTKKNDESICIAVVPWLGSCIPWYAITIALLLNRKGKNIFLLFIDLPFGDDELFHRVQSNLIFRVLNKLPIKLIKLSDYPDQDVRSNEISQLSKLNSLHYTHGETNHKLRQIYESTVEKQLEPIYSKLESFFKEENFNQIILPGGVWGPSSIVALFAEKNSIQLTTYDSDVGELLMSNFGIAAQLKDIPYSFKRLLNNSQEKSFAVQKGLDQIHNRRFGKDSGSSSHFIKATDIAEYDNNYYLMLLNSVWDTAALGLHTVYETMMEWILDSIDWVLKNTNRTIIIRQHPAERSKHIDNTDAYDKKIKARFGDNKRIKFIKASENVNTYDLIEKSFCVLGFSSTIVVESVALGKPAVIVSSAYFDKFGIVYNASSKKEYYMYLKKALENELIVTQEMKDRACVSNYITQSCNWYKTEFTPVRNNYLKWSKLSLEELEKDYLPLQAILKNVPLSIIQHERFLNDIK